jgi:hypothetical protein
MTVYQMVKDFVTSKVHLEKHKKQLKTKYIKFSQSLLTTHIMPSLNQFVRHLIVEKGLNPDYVPPPPAPPTPPVDRVYPPLPPPEVISGRIMRAQTIMRGGDSQSWVGPSFTDLSKHPVMKSRAAFELKQVKPQPIPLDIEEPALVPTVEEISAMEQVKEFLEKGAKTPVKLEEVAAPIVEPVKVVKKLRKKPVKKVEPKKVDVKKAVKKSTVTKSFGGGFRRVDDK